MTTWTPDRVRAVRGGRTRADFASLVGVSPLTIYRWELPESATEARRPRRASRDRLAELERQRIAAAEPHRDPTERPPPPHPPPAPPSSVDASPVFVLLAEGRWSDAEELVLDTLASSAVLSEPDRAELQSALACIQLFARDDARAALGSLAPVLAIAEAGRLPSPTAARVRSLAALIFASADGRLFDPLRVAQEAARVPRTAPEDVVAGAVAAELLAAARAGEGALFLRLYRRDCALLGAARDPVSRAAAAEVRAMEAALRGQWAEAPRRWEEVRSLAEQAGLPAARIRATAHGASLDLLDGRPAPEVLEELAEARSIAREAGLRDGLPELLRASAEVAARYRMGEWAPASPLAARVDELAPRQRWPTFELLLPQGRMTFDVGGLPAVQALHARWVERWGDEPRSDTTAAIRMLQGLIGMYEGTLDRARGDMEEAARLAREAGTIGVLEAFAQLMAFGCDAFVGAVDRVEQSHRDALRVLERAPGGWMRAILDHIRGVQLATLGRAPEAWQALRSAVAVQERAGDVFEVARTRRTWAMVASIVQEPGADELLRRSAEELESLGIEPAAVQTDLSLEVLRKRSAGRRRPDGLSLEALVVPLERLAAVGRTAEFVRREVLWAARDVLGGLETELTPAARGGRFVVDDGSGGRWALSTPEGLEPRQEAALRVICATGSLAMETAALRAFADVPDDVGPTEAPAVPGVVAESAEMGSLLADLARVAPSGATILIEGESGVGKEVLAAAVHQLSPRRAAPYVVFNSAAVPAELFEGQLFGYRKGAFTGATRDHPGIIRSADGGTLFLDEIGELPASVQAKLLRFLENGEVQPLGATQPVQVDVRVVGATHRSLRQLVAEGSFREDLYYRLQVVTLRVPPLRERRADVLPLARHFLARLRPDGDVPRLAADAVLALAEHEWPGNVRELRNVVERTLAFASDAHTWRRADLRFE